MASCDVLVIGAGPGGGSAALHSARSGLSTMIVEADPEVGVPVHCGECLSQMAIDNLDLDLPEHVVALDCKGCLLYTSPSPRDKRQSRMPSSA